jgi:hypothetical protein
MNFSIEIESRIDLIYTLETIQNKKRQQSRINFIKHQQNNTLRCAKKQQEQQKKKLAKNLKSF